MKIFFVSDIHGHVSRYQALFEQIKIQKPDIVLMGGDLLPHYRMTDYEEFIFGFLVKNFSELKSFMENDYPYIGLILGNDDPRSTEKMIISAQETEIWEYLNLSKVNVKGLHIYGYSFVPPTPFLLKDWEKYDVSRYVDPGCIAPVDGFRTVTPDYDPEFSTIADDLEKLTSNDDVSNAIFLFHSPPYQTRLDRAALDGKMVDHVPLDVHVGSVAIRRFIENRQPFITLHGHIHESSLMTGAFADKIGSTWMFNAAIHTNVLSLVMIDTRYPEKSERFLYV